MEKKNPDTSVLVKKTGYNNKITKIVNKTHGISSLARNAALTAVKNGIPDISSSVKKPGYRTKLTKVTKKLTVHNHDKYMTLQSLITLQQKFLMQD